MFKRNDLYTKVVSFLMFFIIVTPFALDTTEPFEKGFTDNEMYAGFSGIGLGKGNLGLGAEYVLGAGINDKLSTIFFVSLESNEYFDDRVVGGGVGVYCNMFDVEKFKIDIMTSVSTDGVFAIATEINVDFSKVGLQLTVGESLQNSGFKKIDASTELTPQIYLNIGESIQVLSAADFVFSTERSKIDVLGFGLNICLTDVIELITETSIDIPKKGENLSVGLSFGFIATMP